MSDQKKSWLSNIITSIITSLAVLAGAWFAFQGNANNADAQRLESAFKRIEYLETEMRQQQANSNVKIIELTSQVFRLQSQLDKDLNIIDMFERFMDGLPFEAWLKEVEYVNGIPTFKMLTINKRYEFTHFVSKIRYRNSEDTDIWPKEVAAKFRELDLKVIRTKASHVTYMEYPVRPNRSDQTIRRMIVKVYLELVDGREMIFGMSIDYKE